MSTPYRARRSPAPLAPGSPDWLHLMTASKVAAVMGLSPYESRFSLWHRMNGTLGPQVESAVMSRGSFHEAGVLAWFRTICPQDRVRANRAAWISKNDPRFAATPDAIGWDHTTGARYGVEVKTSTSFEWGEPGTDQVPPAYRVQAMWQAHIIGLDYVYLPMLGSGLRHACYRIDYDVGEATDIETEVAAFLHDLDAGIAPDLDAHGATYQAVRTLHPDIDPITVEIDPDLAANLRDTQVALKHFESLHAEAKTRLADAMGDAGKAECQGQPVAARRARRPGRPYVQLSPALIDLRTTSQKESA